MMTPQELGHKLYMEMQYETERYWPATRHHQRAMDLLVQGADPNYDFKGFTVLMAASLRGDAELCRELIMAGAEKDILYRGKHDAAFYARSGRHLQLAEWLEQAHAPVWNIFDTESVARSTTNEKLGLKLTQIFNFTTRERVTLQERTADGQISPPCVEKFDTLPPQQVERAEKRFKHLLGC